MNIPDMHNEQPREELQGRKGRNFFNIKQVLLKVYIQTVHYIESNVL